MDLTLQLEGADIKLRQKVGERFAKKIRDGIDDCDLDNPEEYIRGCLVAAYSNVVVKQCIPGYRKKKDTCFEVCGFCMDSIYAGAFKRRFVCCGSSYHRRCIDRWLFAYNNTTCPCCKAVVCNLDVHGAKCVLAC